MKKVILSLLSFFLCGIMSTNAQDVTEPDFLYDGYIITNDGGIIPAGAYKAYTETYADWGHDQRYAVRIKLKGATSSLRVKENESFRLVIRIGNNEVAPSSVFSIIPMKQKKNDRRINFIGFFKVQSVNSTTKTDASVNVSENILGTNVKAEGNQSTTVSYTSMPGYQDRFPQSEVRLQGKKLGNESYILNIPPLEKGEYALTFKLDNNEIMIIDFTVK